MGGFFLGGLSTVIFTLLCFLSLILGHWFAFFFELVLLIPMYMFYAYALRVYINSQRYGTCRKYTAAVYASIVVVLAILMESIILAYVDECSTDNESISCLALAAVQTPIALGPFLLAFGYLFLLYERGAMAKRYEKSKYLLKPELHPKVNAQRIIQ